MTTAAESSPPKRHRLLLQDNVTPLENGVHRNKTLMDPVVQRDDGVFEMTSCNRTSSVKVRGSFF
jgi:hypothetical protein